MSNPASASSRRRHGVLSGGQLLDYPAQPEPLGAGDDEWRLAVEVLRFKVNDHVLDLIDWSNPQADPIYHLTFPQEGMLTPDLREAIHDCSTVAEATRRLSTVLRDDPGDQIAKNVPTQDGVPLHGIQHKYPQTVLLFPAAGQACFSFCGYCFRWPQFLPTGTPRHTLRSPGPALTYLREHPEVTDVLVTGGDPLVMSTRQLRRWIEPIVEDCPHVRSIRFGSKALSYWPYRFTDQPDGPDLIDLFAEIRASGRAVHLMAHLSHPQEMRPRAFAEAVAAVHGAGATIRSQAPLVAHVNDSAEVWAQMWQRQVEMGIVPYYLFVARPTGPHGYYSVPLARSLEIYRDAQRQVSGLARTARGPVMSCSAGKVCLDGVIEVGGERYFLTRFLQARDPAAVGSCRLYHFDDTATWIDELVPYAG